MHFTSKSHHADGLFERTFTLDDVPGILWTPAPASAAAPAPLLLLGHPGRLQAMYPRLLQRARNAARHGFASVTIELPQTGARPATDAMDQARSDLRTEVQSGRRPSAELIDQLVLPLVDQAVPEWQTVIDATLDLPEVREPVGYSGGNISVGVRLARVEPRVVAAVLFAGSFIPGAITASAPLLTIPVHVLLQWDDEHNDRQMALDLFDAIGSKEKTLVANMGGHTGVPASAGDEADRFLARHLH